MKDALNIIIDHLKIDTISLEFESETKFINKVESIVKYLVELREKDTVEETDNLYEASIAVFYNQKNFVRKTVFMV